MLSKSNKIRLFFYGLLSLVIGWNFFPKYDVDPTLERHYKEYVDLYNEVCPMAHYAKPVQMSIHFDDLEGRIIGYCREYLGGWEIRIDKTFWGYSNNIYKESLIKHELSHCILKIDHNDRIKGHYMNSEMSYTPPEMLDLQVRGDMVKRCREIHVRPTN